MKRVIRVFPRRTKATPTDNLAAINRIPDLRELIIKTKSEVS